MLEDDFSSTMTSTMMKKRVRRAHSKSRNGCVNCKKLRVKCDEMRPACSNCIKRKRDCEYVQQSQHTLSSNNNHRNNSMDDHINTNTSPENSQIINRKASISSTGSNNSGGDNYVISSNASVNCSPPLAFQSLNSNKSVLAGGDNSSNLNGYELEILHHYKIAAKSFIVSYGTLDSKIWQDYIPKLVLQVPHLSHSFFAITGLHLAHVSKGEREDITNFALSNFYKAMGEFEYILKKPNNSVIQTEAAFLSTIFLMMMSFCFQNQLPMIGHDNNQVDVLTLTRGPIIVAKNLYPNLMHSNICLFLNQRSTQFNDMSDNYTVFDKLCRITNELYNLKWIQDQQEVYLFNTVLVNLKTCIKFSSLYDSPAGLIGWQMSLPHRFLYLARANHFFAKIILIYHLVSLVAIQDLFWIGQRPTMEITNLSNQLDLQWSSLILWPLSLSSRTDLTIQNIWDFCCTEVEKVTLDPALETSPSSLSI